MPSSKLFKNGIRYSFFSIPTWFSQDIIKNETITEQTADRTNVIEESGWDRLKRTFTPDEFGNISQEANLTLQAGTMSIFTGALIGGILNSRIAYMEFMRTNDATSFPSHLEAKAKLQEKVMLAFGKGAFKWSWRLTLFTTSIVGISTAIQVYRNKYGIVEYTAAGGLTGALYRFNMGPKGWVAGGVVGSVLGTVAGLMTASLLKLSGMSMAEIRYWQYQWSQQRKDLIKKAQQKAIDENEFAVISIHNKQTGEEGKSIENMNKISEDKTKDNVDNKL